MIGGFWSEDLLLLVGTKALKIRAQASMVPGTVIGQRAIAAMIKFSRITSSRFGPLSGFPLGVSLFRDIAFGDLPSQVGKGAVSFSHFLDHITLFNSVSKAI